MVDGSSEAPLSPPQAQRATWVLIAVRAGYAYNWFTIGPALPAIGASFAVGAAAWGVLVAAFLLGAGLFQVPAGLLSRRFGPRRVALAGAALLGIASVASGFAPSYGALLALRVIAGAGAAFFFSPAIGLVASLFPEGKRGLPVGGFSSAFSAGAALGIFLSAIAVQALGWGPDLALGGLGLLVLTVFAVLLIPASAGSAPRFRPRHRGHPRSLHLASLWAIGIAFVGVEGASFATGQFIVPYGTSTLGWSAALAGAVGIGFVLPSVAGGPLGGTAAERWGNRRTQFVIATLVGTAVIALLPWAGLLGAIAIGVAFSLSYGFIYAVMYVLPSYLPGLPAEEIPIGIGLFNSIQLAGGAGVAALFAWVVDVSGYSLAWPVLAGLMVAPLAALALVPATARPGVRRYSAASGDPRAEGSPARGDVRSR